MKMERTRKGLFDAVRPFADGFMRDGASDTETIDLVDQLADRLGLPREEAAIATSGINYLALLSHVTGRQPDAPIRAVAGALAEHASRYGQDKTPERLAEFVAQIANETGGFKLFEENLSYSANRIRQVWPARVKTLAEAQRLARNPEALANVVYQRASMGNTQPGDGWRYRGRGALQLTFRNNYRHYGRLLGLPLEEKPELAADPAVSTLIALEFFKQGKVNQAVDRGDFREARRITNGGSLGLEEVARLRRKALEFLR
jgi:putative chitinase